MIEWRDEYSVENVDIDREHKQLISLINRLQMQTLNEISRDVLNQTVFEMLLYAENHFTHEEILMKQKDFPGYMDHKQKHDDFRMKIDDFKADLEKYEEILEITKEILFFLQRWLITHIKGTDRHYIPYLKKGEETE